MIHFYVIALTSKRWMRMHEIYASKSQQCNKDITRYIIYLISLLWHTVRYGSWLWDKCKCNAKRLVYDNLPWANSQKMICSQGAHGKEWFNIVLVGSVKITFNKRQHNFQQENYRKLSHKIAEGFSSVMCHDFQWETIICWPLHLFFVAYFKMKWIRD